jgi:hypothetical protein
MGESQEHLPGFSFNRSIRVEARDSRLTTNSGALLVREVLERSGLLASLKQKLVDARDPALITHPLSELIATRLCLLALGHHDQDDADALRADAALKIAVSERRGTAPLAYEPGALGEVPRNPAVPHGLASQPTLSRLMASLADDENRPVLREELLETFARVRRSENRGHRRQNLTVDVDALPIRVEGSQPGSAYHGGYRQRMYHPLVATLGDREDGGGEFVDLVLREGSAHCAEGGLEFIPRLVDRLEREWCVVAAVRIDAGMPDEPLLKAMEDRGTPYVARIKNNAVLERLAEPYLKRPRGRRPNEERVWCHELTYAAESWSRERRMVLVVLDRPGELYLHHFWLVTNWTAEQVPGEELLEHYRTRGCAEANLGELMSALQPALSSSPRSRTNPCDAFEINEATLLLNALAYNVLTVLRRKLERRTREGWSVKRVQERALKVAGRWILHARRPLLSLDRAAARFWRWLLEDLQKMPRLRAA